jgi:uncharacterized protein (UPF0147 family)
MNQLIKLHLGLFKYIKTELPKKKTLKEFIKFLKQIIEVYLKELIKLYKNLFLVFDIDYKNQKKQYDNYNKIKKELQQALKMLQYVDKRMIEQKVPRNIRRQFWNDFRKNGTVRKETFDQLLKEINQIGG